jgi:hypothetical protein
MITIMNGFMRLFALSSVCFAASNFVLSWVYHLVLPVPGRSCLSVLSLCMRAATSLAVIDRDYVVSNNKLLPLSYVTRVLD